MKPLVFLILLISHHICIAETEPPIKNNEINDRIEMLQQIGTIYFQEGNLDSAIDAYNRILKIDPYHKRSRFWVGLIHLSKENYKEAIEIISALVDEYPDDYQSINNLAWIYATAKDAQYRDADRAVQLAQKALVLAPYDHHVWSTLSEAYYVANDFEKANRAIRHLVNLATSSNTKMSKDMVDTYNKQIQKCQRAIEAEKLLNNTQ